MSYVESNLITGEQVISYGKIHWHVYIPGLVVITSGITLLKPMAFLSSILILVGAILLIRGWINTVSTELAITNKRVIAKFGLIRRSTVELLHSNVEGFMVEQGIIGRLLNFGTVVVNGTGSGKTPIPSISAPLDFRNQALAAIESNA